MKISDYYPLHFDNKIFVVILQYLRRVIHPAAQHVIERFALLMCIGIIWAFAAILTVAGAYNNAKDRTQKSCRTDRSYLMSTAPWYVQIGILSLIYSEFECFPGNI